MSKATHESLPTAAQRKLHLRFLTHVKVKKPQTIDKVIEEQISKPDPSDQTEFTAVLHKDHVEFLGVKGGKKPPVKKMKYSKVNRVVSEEGNLAVFLASSPGKNATVTVMGFREKKSYEEFLSGLEQHRGKKKEPPTQASQKSMNPTDKTLDAPSIIDMLESSSTLPSVEVPPRIERGRQDEQFATSYIFWEESEREHERELVSANVHMPQTLAVPSSTNTSSDPTESLVKQAISNDSECMEPSEIVTEEDSYDHEVRHCPCCIQRSGINIKLSQRGNTIYAPSSAEGRAYVEAASQPPERYRRMMPRLQPPPIPPEPALTGDFNSDYDESTILDFDETETLTMCTMRPRHRSLPPPIPIPYYQLSDRPRRVREPHPRPYRRRSRRMRPVTWTEDSSTMSSSSSGYTSATFHEDGLELTVDPATSGKYIRNQKRIVTGRLQPEMFGSSRKKTTELYCYRTNSSGPRRR